MITFNEMLFIVKFWGHGFEDYAHLFTGVLVCDSPSPFNLQEFCLLKDTHFHFFVSVVDGGWSKWTSWNKCPVTCDWGNHTRSRKCDNPSPQHGGRECKGKPVENRVCYAGKRCPSRYSSSNLCQNVHFCYG